MRALASAALLAAASVACDGGGGYERVVAEASLWDGPAGEARERTYTVERWDTVWKAGADADDRRLLFPYWVQPLSGGVAVFDAGAQRLLAFAPDGRERWRFGRQGGGPDEFRNVRDVKGEGDSLVHLLDPQNNRIVVMGADGQVRRRIPLDAAGHAEQMAPLPGGRIVLATLRPDSVLMTIDAAGRRGPGVPVAWEALDEVHPLARQGLTATGPDGRWVYGFMLGDGWFAYEGLRPAGGPRRYADHRPFPVVEVRGSGGTSSAALATYAPCTGCALALADSSLYVLAGGSDRSGRGVVDRFSLADGGYRESFRLPGRARQIAVRGADLYVVVDEPYPGVLALRPRA